MKFFSRRTKWAFYSKFFSFSNFCLEVTNLFSCTKLLVVTRRRVVNYVTDTDSHTWGGNGFFLENKLLFLNILKFSLFHFSNLSVYYSANFQQLGTELILNVYLWPILPSPGNNSIPTKWALYLWNATNTNKKRGADRYFLYSSCPHLFQDKWWNHSANRSVIDSLFLQILLFLVISVENTVNLDLY